MGVKINNGYGQVNFVHQLAGGGREFLWTMGFLDSTGTFDPVGACTQIYAAWTGAGKPYLAANMSTQVKFLGVDVTIYAGGLPYIASKRVPITGTMVSETLPLNVAMLMKKNTSFGGRRNRGRAFLPPIWVSEGNIGVGGLINETQRAATEALFASALTAMNATNYPAYLLHGVVEYPPRPINSIAIETYVATIRKRLVRS